MKVLRMILVAVVVIGLAIDAVVHLRLASAFDPIGDTITQGQLFRVEGVAAILAAVFLLVRPSRLSAAVAALVAGGGASAVVFYAVIDVGAIGPVPDMYDPTWSAEKTLSAVAEAAAALAALALLVIGVRTPEATPAGVSSSHAGAA